MMLCAFYYCIFEENVGPSYVFTSSFINTLSANHLQWQPLLQTDWHPGFHGNRKKKGVKSNESSECLSFTVWHQDLVLLELITYQTASKSCKLCSKNHERLSIWQGAHRASLPNEEWPSSTHNMCICNSVDCTPYSVKSLRRFFPPICVGY
ncbi:uncharacterized protein LOC118164634 [Oxyura jamaicensis]|uniref:uncharacterized protein LOC118164634 n=1 Tax=Oxyura jamaicensis TaxID=8884 RepID=UPI0015A604C8|nr:uncharacterized protein LOC118164634 [Oxyura jamaicensis]